MLLLDKKIEKSVNIFNFFRNKGLNFVNVEIRMLVQLKIADLYFWE